MSNHRVQTNAISKRTGHLVINFYSVTRLKFLAIFNDITIRATRLKIAEYSYSSIHFTDNTHGNKVVFEHFKHDLKKYVRFSKFSPPLPRG